MLGPGGGSIHDPSASLPAPMWDRAQRQSEIRCRSCASTGKQKVGKSFLSTSGTVWWMCQHCDGGVWATRT